MESLRIAAGNIRAFHEMEKKPGFFIEGKYGEILGKKVTPIETAGVYIPGGIKGQTPLVSSVLMNIIPAQAAGCSRIYACTPPNNKKSVNPYILAALDMLGIREVYKCGGAHAIAAMAYGTRTIPKADVIAGPGGKYVSAGKKAVYGKVKIDGIYGPSELVIIADKNNDPAVIASDVLSQSEHAGDETSILISDSDELIQNVIKEINIQLESLPRADIIISSLEKYGMAIHVKNLDDALSLADYIAPEHLELCFNDAVHSLGKVKNAGAVFIGKYSAEPIGDYIAGVNHVLPTNRTARWGSPLGVSVFLKESNIIIYNREAYKAYAAHAEKIARIEGLHAHANSLRKRY
jgi:histidinol dehydrogenase